MGSPRLFRSSVAVTGNASSRASLRIVLINASDPPTRVESKSISVATHHAREFGHHWFGDWTHRGATSPGAGECAFPASWVSTVLVRILNEGEEWPRYATSTARLTISAMGRSNRK